MAKKKSQLKKEEVRNKRKFLVDDTPNKKSEIFGGKV